MANAEVDRKLALLPQLLQRGERGINYLIDCLSDRELIIKAKAYELLQNISSQKVQLAIAPGILLNPGDRIFRVLRAVFSFNDSFYNLYQSFNGNKIKCLVTEEDYRQQGYQIIRFDEVAYVVATEDYYLDYQPAELAAKQLSQQIISKFSITEFEINDRQTIIKQWCSQHQIIDKVTALQREKYKNIDIDTWNSFFGISDDSENIDIYWSTVEEYLKSVSSFKLLEKLWQNLVGNLSCIQEITFAKPTYIKIDPYYSQIIASTSSFIFVDGDEEAMLLPPEESETNLLIKALNHSQLEIRNLAYKLLRGIDLETARQAIHGGIRLNPADKVYSVYQSGIWFDDRNYNIYDERYLIDYLDDLNYQIYGRKLLDEEEERIKCKRVYCYLDKELAEEKSEALHREMLQKAGIGIGGFEWRKENPKFNLRQWCQEHNISDKAMRGIEYSIEDEYLADNFRRSKYIYHSKHIDTWCDDNQVNYNLNLDNWDNYRKVIDYLYLPENIALLSKFWKDGVGYFAFATEEIVQETIYLKPGENLSDRPELENLKLQSSLKPENYPELASKFFIRIIENKYASVEHKLKARELLQNIPGEYLPF